MEISVKQLACLSLAVLGLAGCATTRFKPQGLTDQEAERKMNELLYVCQGLRQGSYINLSFYPDNADSDKNAYSGNRSGYFYACNKMNGTLSMSSQRLTMFDRGELYPLRYIETLTRVPDPLPQTALAGDFLDTLVKKVFEVRHDDPERSLLTQ